MKFGKVDDPENVDFTLPPDHAGTKKVLSLFKRNNGANHESDYLKNLL